MKFLMYYAEIFTKMSSANSAKLAEKSIHLCLMTKMAWGKYFLQEIFQAAL